MCGSQKIDGLNGFLWRDHTGGLFWMAPVNRSQKKAEWLFYVSKTRCGYTGKTGFPKCRIFGKPAH
ncbi:protein of unknown function [Acidithiobacillus ferrivorans]|uniref:Uncharacterized protein n=1 Tax=Acidithiobacillus ferrivorans TaxID=160808 RepID=A0A060URK9_9PROT|nr:hypothetical protein AFERRI_240043 [Acidithiobacillus ferrivorans]SMH64876.1 protein of unknown function [Acidithiobacillus ferrivorans]